MNEPRIIDIPPEGELTEEQKAMLMLRAVVSDIRTPEDLELYHAAAALVKDSRERAKRFNAKALAMEKAWEQFREIMTPHLINVINQQPDVTAGGNPRVATPTGSTYVSVRKKDSLSMEDEDAMLSRMLEKNSLDELVSAGYVELVPKLTPKGKDAYKERGYRVLGETGELLPGLALKQKGERTLTTRVAKITERKQVVAAQRFLMSPFAALDTATDNENETDD